MESFTKTEVCSYQVLNVMNKAWDRSGLKHVPGFTKSIRSSCMSTKRESGPDLKRSSYGGPLVLKEKTERGKRRDQKLKRIKGRVIFTWNSH